MPHENKVGGVAIIHWLRADPQGPIETKRIVFAGTQLGGRYRIACKPGRATLKNLDVTDYPPAVTCEKCKSSKAYLALPESSKAKSPVALHAIECLE